MRCIYDGIHPCGKCPACLANRQRAFCFRLDHERKFCSFYFWLTLQYDDNHVPRLEDGEMCFSKSDCRFFFERLRRKYKDIKFKHFLVSEYGPNGTHRPHYHCLLLVYSDLRLEKLYVARQEMKEYICNVAWENGHVTEKSFHGRVLSYLTKYCTKPELIGEKHTMKPFTLISKGIGQRYLENLTPGQINYMRENLDFSVRYGSGKMQLPRYYIDKILPHGKDDLRKLIPSDPVSGDWSAYDQLSLIRKRIFDKNNNQVLRRVVSNTKSISEEIRQRQINIDGSLEEFRSKLRNRKNL